MAEPMYGPVLSDKTAEEATKPLLHCAIAFIVINTAIVVFRFASRNFIAKLPFWWDDFWVLPAYFFSVALAALGIAMLRTAIAYDNTDRVVLDPAELSVILKQIYAFIQMLLAVFAATRYSILALYLRIFSDKGVRRATWCAVAFITIQYFSFALAAIFMCRPVEFFWNRTLPNGQCNNIDAYYRSVTIPNMVMDIVIIVIPLPTVWHLKSPSIRKWALTSLFCIGSIALVASCLRLWIYETHTGEIIAPQYINVLVAWLIAEPSIYLLAVCLPAMHHIFAAVVPTAVNDMIDRRMAALRHPLSSETARDSGGSQNDPLSKHGLYGDFSRLADHENEGNNSLVQAERRPSGRKGSGKDVETYEMERGNLPQRGIVVTHEVIVTQEERIADVIGF